MKLIYIANARIPTEKAHGIQIMKMCQAFAESMEVELIVPRRLNRIKDEPFAYYGLARTFKIKKLPCLDLIPLCKYLGHFGLWVESLTFFFFVFWYIIFRKADVFYTRDKFSLPLTLIKKNIIFESHTFPKNYFLYSLFFKKATEIVVITQKLKDLLMERGISPDKILVAPDGVDLAEFSIKETKGECRKKLNLPQDKKIILYTGHLYEWKGAQTLAEASPYLPEDANIYFVGGIKEDIERFKSQILNLKSQILVVGHRPHAEIPYWLRASDVLILPNSGKEDISKYWTSPMKMFEYMASGRPIVASDLPSLKEVLNENNSVLVEPDSPEKLSEGIKKILDNPELAEKISGQAFKEVQDYTWSNRAKKFLWFFQKN